MPDTDHASCRQDHNYIKAYTNFATRICIISSEESDKWGMLVLPERQADIKAFSMGLHLLSM